MRATAHCIVRTRGCGRMRTQRAAWAPLIVLLMWNRRARRVVLRWQQCEATACAPARCSCGWLRLGGGRPRRARQQRRARGPRRRRQHARLACGRRARSEALLTAAALTLPDVALQTRARTQQPRNALRRLRAHGEPIPGRCVRGKASARRTATLRGSRACCARSAASGRVARHALHALKVEADLLVAVLACAAAARARGA